MIREEDIFWHECIYEGCTTQVQMDDEPWCDKHAPYLFATISGYSAKSRRIIHDGMVRHNIFDITEIVNNKKEK